MGGTRRKAQTTSTKTKVAPPAPKKVEREAVKGKEAQTFAVQPPPTSDGGQIIGLRVTLLNAKSLIYIGNGGEYKLRSDGRPLVVTDQVDMEYFKLEARCSCQLIFAPKRQKL